MSSLPQATLKTGYSTGGTLGHGFKLMFQTVDRVWVFTGPKGTTVVLEQGRNAPLPHWLMNTCSLSHAMGIPDRQLLSLGMVFF